MTTKPAPMGLVLCDACLGYSGTWDPDYPDNDLGTGFYCSPLACEACGEPVKPQADADALCDLLGVTP